MNAKSRLNPERLSQSNPWPVLLTREMDRQKCVRPGNKRTSLQVDTISGATLTAIIFAGSGKCFASAQQDKRNNAYEFEKMRRKMETQITTSDGVVGKTSAYRLSVKGFYFSVGSYPRCFMLLASHMELPNGKATILTRKA